MKRHFTAGYDPTVNAIGWKPDAVRAFDYRSNAFSVAHDTMEHSVEINATFTDELLAHGAALYVRPNYFADMPKALGENLAWFYEQIHLGKIKPPAWDWEQGASDAEFDIHNILRTLNGIVRLNDEENRLAHEWLTEGYRMAVERYRGIPRDVLESAFMNIEREMKRVTPHAQDSDRLIVHLAGTGSNFRSYVEHYRG